jgi:hypothetical protein
MLDNSVKIPAKSMEVQQQVDMANPTGRGGFKKGKSGNPGSQPHQLASLMHEARRHTFEAIRVGQAERRRSNPLSRLGNTDPGASVAASRNDRTGSGGARAHRRDGKPETTDIEFMSNLREIIRDERRRRRGPARGPLKPVLSPTGDRIVGRQTGASAFIVGDPRGRIWQQPDETFEAFKKRVEAATDAASKEK